MRGITTHSNSGDAHDYTFLQHLKSINNSLSLPPSKLTSTPFTWKSKFKSLLLRRRRRHHRLHHLRCQFLLHVHSLRNLPSSLGGTLISVHFSLAGDISSAGAGTIPARVVDGVAEFVETISCSCSVAASPVAGGMTEYQPRSFSITALVVGGAAGGIVLGRHQVDMSRLLPGNADDLREGKGEKWRASFPLSAAAEGGRMEVSFGFLVLGDGEVDDGVLVKNLPKVSGSRDGSLNWDSCHICRDTKVLREVPKISDGYSELRNFECSILDRYLTFGSRSWENGMKDIEQCRLLKPAGGNEDFLLSRVIGVMGDEEGNEETESDEFESVVIDKGVEFVTEEKVYEVNWNEIESEDDVALPNRLSSTSSNEKANSTITDAVIDKREPPYNSNNSEEANSTITNEESNSTVTSVVKDRTETAHSIYDNEEGLMMNADELADTLFSSICIPECSEIETGIFDKAPKLDDRVDACSGTRTPSMKRSGSLDDVMESVASEFLSMLGIESSTVNLSSENCADLPRQELQQLFEMERLHGRTDALRVHKSWTDDVFKWGDFFHDLSFDCEADSWLWEAAEDNADRMPEDEDDWDSDDDDEYQYSPPADNGGFGSPIDLPPDEPIDLPTIGEALRATLRTKDGGYIHLVSPSCFGAEKNNESCLILQASCPIVLPAVMGSGITNTLQHLASFGTKKLSIQVNKMMPLEDMTGKTMQQIFKEGKPIEDTGRSHDEVQNKCQDSEYFSLEDLAPFSIHEIKALLIEGLRIQSGMAEENAPSSINVSCIDELSSMEGKVTKRSWFPGRENTAQVHFQDTEDGGEDVNELMGLCITLDEWTKFDSGRFSNDNQTDDRVCKILTAHHANSVELNLCEGKPWNTRTMNSGRCSGFLPNEFTVCIRVQLRDPLHNLEPVGAPMLSLFQVKDTDGRNMQPVTEKTRNEAIVSHFQIDEMHVAGVNIESEKSELWGNSFQRQSASRWLLHTGMGKSSELALAKMMAAAKPAQVTTVLPTGDYLWSTTTRVNGTKWKELEALNPFIRNPNILFP